MSKSMRSAVAEENINTIYDEDYYKDRVLLPSLEAILPLKSITVEEIVEPKNQAQLDNFIG